jgi:hypothetical protein
MVGRHYVGNPPPYFPDPSVHMAVLLDTVRRHSQARIQRERALENYGMSSPVVGRRVE